MEVIRARAAELEAPLFGVGTDILISEEHTGIEGTSCRLKPVQGSQSRLSSILPRNGIVVQSPLLGLVQTKNMALAALACASSLENVTAQSIQEGLLKAFLPARFEILRKKQYIVLDGAHTPDSMRLTLETMNSLFPGRKILLFACAHDKKHEDMAQILASHFEYAIVTRPGSFKASEPDAVFASFSRTKQQANLVPDTGEAIRTAIYEAEKRNCPLLVTGSFYLCAEVKSLLEGSE
jgi:dihydrofolate synthase/folylpolyglutamate synthase